MTDTILFQEPGVTIAYDDQAHTVAPYGHSVRPNGDVNHGFIDQRDRPELVHLIPEANASPGLQKILVALNRKGLTLHVARLRTWRFLRKQRSKLASGDRILYDPLFFAISRPIARTSGK